MCIHIQDMSHVRADRWTDRHNTIILPFLRKENKQVVITSVSSCFSSVQNLFASQLSEVKICVHAGSGANPATSV
jgi:hypothetical protein